MLKDLHCVEVGLHVAGKSIRAENNALTQEVTEQVVDRNELNLPAESLEHVFLLRNELFVAVRDPYVVEQLVDARVGLLKVLGTNE